jgi:hypothetical protein
MPTGSNATLTGQRSGVQDWLCAILFFEIVLRLPIYDSLDNGFNEAVVFV